MADTTTSYLKGETFEQFWASLQEIRKMHREIAEEQKEIDRIMKENARERKEIDLRMKETDRMMKENVKERKETDRQMKETNLRIGYLDNRFGELAEHLVAPGIMEKFNDLGFDFTRGTPNVKVKETGSKKSLAEIDILLENGDIIIAVEVKAKPREKDIAEFIGKMKILRNSANNKQDKRKYQGAIAGIIMGDNIRRKIHENGFYLIEPSGDTVKINIPEGFIPRDF